MSAVNLVILLGRIGQAPEIRRAKDGFEFVTASLATNSHWVDKTTGERKQAAEWHRLRFEDHLFDQARTLRVGEEIYCEGSLRTHKWTSREGVEQFYTQVHVTSFNQVAHASRAAPQQPPQTPSPRPARQRPPAQQPAGPNSYEKAKG